VSAGCHSVGGKKPSEMVKNWVLHHDNVPCQTALAVQQLLVQNQTAPPSNYLSHQISLHATSVTSQGPRPDSKVIILHLQKKFIRILQHVSEPYQKMTSRDTSSNGRTAGASCTWKSEVLPVWLSYSLYTFISVRIMTTLQEHLIFPHNTVQHMPVSNAMLDNTSAWKQRRCAVLRCALMYCSNTEHNTKQRWLQHCK